MNYSNFDGWGEGIVLTIGITAVSAFVGAKVAKKYGQPQIIGAVITPIVVFVALKSGNKIYQTIKQKQNAGKGAILPSMTTPLM
jgi:hypothetical protein